MLQILTVKHLGSTLEYPTLTMSLSGFTAAAPASSRAVAPPPAARSSPTTSSSSSLTSPPRSATRARPARRSARNLPAADVGGGVVGAGRGVDPALGGRLPPHLRQAQRDGASRSAVVPPRRSSAVRRRGVRFLAVLALWAAGDRRVCVRPFVPPPPAPAAPLICSFLSFLSYLTKIYVNPKLLGIERSFRCHDGT